MSQSRESFKEKLHQQRQKAKGEADSLPGVVEWIQQELLELEFTEHLGAGR